MNALETVRLQLAYSDEMNRRLLDAAEALDDGRLDQSFEMGPGSLRRTLRHIVVGETVWLERWKGNAECPWPPYETTLRPADMKRDAEALWPQRDAFLATLTDAKLSARQPYRDSKGNRFSAALHEMILQGITHSIHHRAQAVNMLRRLGGGVVEVDFMYWRRQPE